MPANKLSEEEREQIIAVANSEEFAHLPPSQMVPQLADRGEYIASELTFYRVLRAAGQLQHRQAAVPLRRTNPGRWRRMRPTRSTVGTLPI